MSTSVIELSKHDNLLDAEDSKHTFNFNSFVWSKITMNNT